MRKIHTDAADVAILVCMGDKEGAEALYQEKIKPLALWETLWFRDRCEYYYGKRCHAAWLGEVPEPRI